MFRSIARVSIILSLALVGCSETAPPESLRLLGVIPPGAYSGVEYSYEFGIDGGEGNYQVTLTNNPSWLTVEYNENPLRPGAVLRGIPGLTGGQATEDPLVRVFREIQLTITDGTRITSRNFNLTVTSSVVSFVETDVVEAEQQDRPQRSVFNTETRRNDLIDIPMCMTDADGNSVVTEDDLSYWLDLIDGLEREEEGEFLTPEERAILDDVFGVGQRPRIVYLPVNFEDGGLVADSFYQYQYLDPDPDSTGDLIENVDYLTQVKRLNGDVLNLKTGYLKIPAGEDLCPMLVFVNDDRIAENIRKGLRVELTNLSEHLYLPETTSGRMTVNDNEPIPQFTFESGSVTKSATQLGPDDPDQPEGTIYRLKVFLDEMPTQDTTADHVVTARLTLNSFQSSGSLGVVSSPADVPFSADDLVIDTSLDFVEPVAGEPAADILFRMETDDDGEDVWVAERDVVLYAPAPGGGANTGTLDKKILMVWDDTETTRESESVQTVNVNEWVTATEYSLSENGEVVAARAGYDGGMYVAYNTEENGQLAAYVDYYARQGGAVEARIPVAFGNAEVRVTAMEILETGQELSATEQLQEVMVTGVVNVLAAPAVRPGAEAGLGGDDILVAYYRRVNKVGPFELVWSRQMGSNRNDRPTSIARNTDDRYFVIGVVQGPFLDYPALGGTDGLISLFDRDGNLLQYRLYGTRGDDGFEAAAVESSFNVFTGGYTSLEAEIGAGGGGFDYLFTAFSDDMTIRRQNQLGTSKDDIGLVATELTRGFLTGGTTTGSLILDQSNAGLRDVFLAYQRTASAVDAAIQIGTEGDDVVTSADALEYFAAAGGSTEGVLFEDGVYGGGADWWLASYDIIQPDPTDSDRGLQLRWSKQGESALDEALKAVQVTEHGKLFRIVEQTDSGAKRAYIEPVGSTDGRVLSVRP